MKKIYWRPRAVSRSALLLISIISIAGLMVVEGWKVESQQPYFEEKLRAANIAQKGMALIKQERIASGEPIDPTTDPMESGVIGLPMSLVTSVSGDVAAKQTSVNPNFAAVVVDMLKELDLKAGDRVAVAVSGSFPALNLCTYAACEALDLEPIVIASASASQWGANVPQLMWLDMEKRLNDEGILQTRSVAASIGGYDDLGLGLQEEGLELVIAAIERNGLGGERLIRIKDFAQNVTARMDLYADHAEGQPIKAFINVGGGTIAVGRDVGKLMFHPGVNTRPPRHVREIDGLMARYIVGGVPVIHIVHINALAERYGLPLSTTASPPPEGEPPAPPQIPRVGLGGVFYGINYSKPLVIGVLAFILMALYGFIRSDVGFRILKSSTSRKRDAQPEPMV